MDRQEGRQHPRGRSTRGIVALIALIALIALVALVGLLGSSNPATAQTTTPEQPQQTGAKGTLRADGEPVADVRITVATEAGAPAGEARSGPDGTWFVPLAAAGRYEVSIDRTTLPPGVRLIDPERSSLDIQVQGGRARGILFGLTRGAATTQPSGSATSQPGGERSADDGTGGDGGGGPSFGDRLARRIVSGLLFGLIIAMTAIGLSLIFGTTGLVNFAHGELVTFGAIVAWFLNVEGPRLHLVFAGVLAIVVGALAGATIEGGLWGPLRKRRTGQFQLLVISIGVSIAVRQALLIWFGSGSRGYRNYGIQDSLSFGPVSITPRNLAIMAISVVVLLAVALLLTRTRIGKAMRAVADNADLAASSGINVRRVILVVWILGGALAAGGGVLQSTATSVQYLRGFQLLLLMFAGVILGGLGTAYGAMIGSLAVGLVTEVSTLFIPAELKTVSALAVLIIVLLVRPQGLLGSRERVG